MKKIYSLAALLLVGAATQAQNTVAEARAMGEGAIVTINAVVTNGSEFGKVRYMQDNTAGMVAFGDETDGLVFGDSIQITGELVDFRGLLEISPISSLTRLGKATVMPEPKLISPNDQGENLEGQLVRINDATFENGGGTFTSTTFNFISNNQTGVSFINRDTDLIDELVPVGAVDVIGLAGQFTFNGTGGYQVLPRSTADLIEKASVSIISPLSQSNINNSTFDLNFKSNKDALGIIYYGTDEDAPLSSYTKVTGASTSNHIINLTGLTAGTVYFAQAAVVLGADTVLTPRDAFATKSNSTGKISVLFNNSVNTDVASSPSNFASSTTAITDSVIAYINRAQSTIDIAMYNNGTSSIITALNNAHDRGVTVRFVAEGQTGNTAIGNLDSEIGFLTRKNATGSGMHNKFLVIDRDDVNNSYIISGSTNFTSAQLNDDPNNMIFIQDQSVARSFTVEFEEMFGSNGAQSNSANARFGAQKRRNTPREFLLGSNNTRVELFFSPSDGTTSGIINAINTIDKNAHLALLVFTRDDIAEALINAAKKFGVVIDGIIDQPNGTGSEFDNLNDNFIRVIAHTGPGNERQLHHKYCIVDVNTTQDPLVITGSHNWSSSAENSNDENLLVIHDADITNQYFQEFSARFAEVTVGIFENIATENTFTVYPNPSNTGIVNLPEGTSNVLVIDALGKSTAYNQNGNVLEFTQNGAYIIQANVNGEVKFARVLVSK